MSAFDRLDANYRTMCEHFGARMGSFLPNGMLKKLSPQNRRVRYAVDRQLASMGEHEHRDTRQQRRWLKRREKSAI